METTEYDLVVVGGGAAGCFAAANAAAMVPGARVLLLEKSGKLLSKVKISGGGRCNLTHNLSSIAEMSKRYPRGEKFVKKAFHHFFTGDTIRWFGEKGVGVKAEADGRMFPESNDSQSVINALLETAHLHGVVFRLSSGVKEMLRQEDASFLIRLEKEEIRARFVIVAGGGFQKEEQFTWLKNIRHSIEIPVPSLFTFNMPGNPIRDLMGVSVPEAQVKITGTKFSETGPLLVTHWGLSGPAVLRLSAWGARELAALNYNFSIIINWMPGFHEQSLREKFQEWRFSLPSQKLINRNPLGLPQRLWEYLLQTAGVNAHLRWADLPAKEQNILIKSCVSQEHRVQGKTTFKEEFVTAGGIRLSEIDPNTMMSRLVPNLCFAGEIMDVDGITGGFNFQHAWTSGFIAARTFASFHTGKTS